MYDAKSGRMKQKHISKKFDLKAVIKVESVEILIWQDKKDTEK